MDHPVPSGRGYRNGAAKIGETGWMREGGYWMLGHYCPDKVTLKAKKERVKPLFVS